MVVAQLRGGTFAVADVAIEDLAEVVCGEFDHYFGVSTTYFRNRLRAYIAKLEAQQGAREIGGTP